MRSARVPPPARSVMGGAGGKIGHNVSGRIMATMTHNPSAGNMTMGRAMVGRVIPYAESHDFGYYKGKPTGIRNALQKVSAKLTDSVDLWTNKKWINYQMMQGKGLVDIGQPPGMPASEFYDMERRQVQGYSGYSKDIQP